MEKIRILSKVNESGKELRWEMDKDKLPDWEDYEARVILDYSFKTSIRLYVACSILQGSIDLNCNKEVIYSFNPAKDKYSVTTPWSRVTVPNDKWYVEVVYSSGELVTLRREFEVYPCATVEFRRV